MINFVLEGWFAQARLYDSGVKRFDAVDVVKGDVYLPETINVYMYCVDNPLSFIDLDGMLEVYIGGTLVSSAKIMSGKLVASLSELETRYGVKHTSTPDSGGIVVWTYRNKDGSNPTNVVVDGKKNTFTFKKMTGYYGKIGSTEYLEIEYFHKLVCGYGKTKKLNIDWKAGTIGDLALKSPPTKGESVPDLKKLDICTDGSLGPNNSNDLMIPDLDWQAPTAKCEDIEWHDTAKTKAKRSKVLDAYVVPYVVLTFGNTSANKGDLAKLTDNETKKSVWCIVGETGGGSGQIHEVSIAAVWALGKQHLTAKAAVTGDFTITFYKGTQANWDWSKGYNIANFLPDGKTPDKDANAERSRGT